MNREMNAGTGGVQGDVETLPEDLRSVVVKQDEAVHKPASKVALKAGSECANPENIQESLKCRLVEARDIVADKTRLAAAATCSYAKSHPWKIVGLAAVTGWVIGLFSRRR